MATDSTELTFVRCPSCRSLVPAVSSRCRMCGAGLDASDELAGDESATASTPDARASRSAAPKGSSATASAPVEEELEAATDSEEEDFNDPLGDYLQDFDDANDDEDGDDESEEIADELAAEAAEEELEEVLEEAPAPVAAATAAAPKLKVENGSKKGGLSFRKNREEPTTRATEPRPTSAPAPAPTASPAAEPHMSKSRVVTPPAARERPPVKERVAARSSERELDDAMTQAPSPSFTRKRDQAGRLYGWLVSFRNANGNALELREGKFFVTSSSLKENDLVLDHPTVSTPHALVSVSSERGLLVQDLMSDRGVFLRASDDDTYRKEEETFRLEHGDWIRFGDEEFLVTLVPSPPRR